MINVDGLNFDGHRTGANGLAIAGAYKQSKADPEYQWIGRKSGAGLLADPSVPNVEIEFPLRVYGSSMDDFFAQLNTVEQKATKAEWYADQGGLDATIQLTGATYTTGIKVLAIIMPDGITDHTLIRQKKMTDSVKLICLPFYMGPEYVAASGTKVTGLPSADITVTGAKGAGLGLMRMTVKNRDAQGQQFVLAGGQWRDAVAGNKLLLRASTFDVATSPLNGAYTAGTNEVQRATVTGGPITAGAYQYVLDGVTIPAGGGSFAYNASLVTVNAAFDAVFGAGNIVASGNPLSAGNMTLTAANDFAGVNLAQIAINVTTPFVGGTVAMSTVTPGAEGYVSVNAQADWSSFCRSADQTDIGSYDIWARVKDFGTVQNKVRIRAAISVGDVENAVINDSVTVSVCGGNSVWVRLGPAHVLPPKAGSHRWNIRLDVKTLGTVGTELRVTHLKKVPIKSGRMCIKTPDRPTKTLVVSDDFNQAAGNLTGGFTPAGVTAATNATPIVITSAAHALNNGDVVLIEGVTGNTAANGRWTVANKTANTFELQGSVGNGAYVAGGTISKGGKTPDLGTSKWFGTGDADDAAIDTTLHRVARSALNDGANAGRFFVIGDVLTDMSVTMPSYAGCMSGTPVRTGPAVRYVDKSNCLVAFGEANASLTSGTFYIYKIVAGAWTLLDSGPFVTGGEITLTARSDGRWSAAHNGRSYGGYAAELATGGALASGRHAWYSEIGAVAGFISVADSYRGYKLSAPDEAIFPSRTLQWNVDGSVEREASGGVYYAPAAGAVRAGAPRIGAAGGEALVNRIAIVTDDLNPDTAATGNPPPAFEYTIYARAVYPMGNNEGP